MKPPLQVFVVRRVMIWLLVSAIEIPNFYLAFTVCNAVRIGNPRTWRKVSANRNKL